MSQKLPNPSDEMKPEGQTDLDARVASLLGEMDSTHDRVVQRLDWPVGSEQEELDRQLSEAMASVAEVADAPPPGGERAGEESVERPTDLDASGRSLDDALSGSMTAAQTPPADVAPSVGAEGKGEVDQGEGASESIAGDVAAQAAEPVAAATVVAPVVEQPVPAPAASVRVEEPIAPIERAAKPSVTMTELDNQLSQALAEPTDDEFADASEVLASEAPLADLKASHAAQVVEQTVAPEPSAVTATAPPTDVKAAAAQPEPAPAAHAVAAVRPAAPHPVAQQAPKPVAKPAAVKAAVSEEPKLTLVDMFWRVATPVVEPIASQLGRLPAKTQQTFAWIGITTMFVGCVTWAYVLFLMPTKPPSHLLEEQEQSEQATDGHGEHDEHTPKSSAKAPAKSDAKHASAEGGHGASAAADGHDEPAPSGHGAAKSAGH